MFTSLLVLGIVIMSVGTFFINSRDVPKIYVFTIIVGCALAAIILFEQGRYFLSVCWMFNFFVWKNLTYNSLIRLTRIKCPTGDYYMDLYRKDITITIRGVPIKTTYRYWWDPVNKDEYTTGSLDELTMKDAWSKYDRLIRAKERRESGNIFYKIFG